MEIIGRLTADAVVKTTKNNRQVVAFSIAINNYYKNLKGERKNITTYVNCSYWINTGIAELLGKGSILSLYGSLSMKAYIDPQGKPQPVLYFHVNNITFITQRKKVETVQEEVEVF